MGRTVRLFAPALKAALAAVFPPQCMGCGAAVAEDGALCPACWRETEFIGRAACVLCGAPVPGDTGAGAAREGRPEDDIPCDECLARPRPWARGAAAVVYRGTGRRLTLALKHADRPHLARPLGSWLARAAAPLLAPGMVVVPVPLHPRRLLTRRYNQAALLAAQVARMHGLPLRPVTLARRRHTPMQDHRGVLDRFANVEGALAVPAARAADVRDRPVLLVDDVMASGATLSAAALALGEAGAGPVSVAVLARAVKDGSRPATGIKEVAGWD